MRRSPFSGIRHAPFVLFLLALATKEEAAAVPFLLPLQFQLVFGWTPFAAGLMVAALFAGNLTIKPVTTPLMRRLGIRQVLLLNGIAFGGFNVVDIAALAAALERPVLVVARRPPRLGLIREAWSTALGDAPSVVEFRGFRRGLGVDRLPDPEVSERLTELYQRYPHLHRAHLLAQYGPCVDEGAFTLGLETVISGLDSLLLTNGVDR